MRLHAVASIEGAKDNARDAHPGYGPRIRQDSPAEARITEEQKKLFLRAAAITGRSLIDFVVLSAHETAVRTVREHDVLALSARDRRVFVAALLKPPAPVKRMREAARRSKRTVDAADPC